jgi:hypothetical protein
MQVIAAGAVHSSISGRNSGFRLQGCVPDIGLAGIMVRNGDGGAASGLISGLPGIGLPY